MNEDFLIGVIAGLIIAAALWAFFEADKHAVACEIDKNTSEHLDQLNFGNWRALKSQYKYLDFECQQKVRDFAFSIDNGCARRILNICSGMGMHNV